MNGRDLGPALKERGDALRLDLASANLERLVISVIVLLGGGALIVVVPEGRDLDIAIVALWGAVVGWWLPRGTNGPAT